MEIFTEENEEKTPISNTVSNTNEETHVLSNTLSNIPTSEEGMDEADVIEELKEVKKKVKLGNSWRRQRVFKKKAHNVVPSYEETIQLVNKFPTLMEQALFAVTYLTGARISEIVQCEYLSKRIYETETIKDKHGQKKDAIIRNENGSPIYKKTEKIKIDYPGILKQNIKFKNHDGYEVMYISMSNRKNKHVEHKTIPITLKHDLDLVNIIKRYLKTLIEPDTPLFPFKTFRARLIFANAIDLNPHYLRDIRMTHSVTEHKLSAHALKKIAGWASIKSSDKYIRLDVSDVIKQLHDH